MRYSELSGKEIIDIGEGTRLGVVGASDLYLDTETGQVAALIMPQRNGWFSSREIVIPWHGVRKVGADFIIVDTSTMGELTPPVRPPAAEMAYVPAPAAAAVPGNPPAPQQTPFRPAAAPIRRVSGFPLLAGAESQAGTGAVPGDVTPVRLEAEAPQVLLQRLAAGEKRAGSWRRGKYRR